jgi:hypothetical protein
MNTPNQSNAPETLAEAAAKPARRGATTKKKAKKAPAKAKRRNTPRPAAKVGATVREEGSKKANVLDLLRRKQGATLAEIMEATSWQAHTVRGFISGALIKKAGLPVESFRNDDKERSYRLGK